MSRLHTPVCDLFGIDVPIFGAGMGGVTLAPLAGAVSKAGGLGVMGLTFHTPEAVRAEIHAIRRITDRPFGVGLIIPTDIPADVRERNIPPFPDFLADLLPRVAGLKGSPPPPLTLELARAQVAVALEERVPVLSAGIGTPEWLVEDAHKAGTKVISVIGAARHASRVSKLGTDCIVAQGMEAGGHVGQIPTAVLVPQVVDQASVPVLAAGGIVDGRGIAAAFALGAQGVWIGTRFLATHEATAHENHKRGIVAADENGTVVSRCYTGKPSRVLRNIVTERWKGHEAEIMPMPWQRIRVEQLVAPAKDAGMVELANFPTGQGAGAIRDIPSTAELMERLIDETVSALQRAAAVAGAR
jgi:NAD(P)H-dependent flavin oxidoreductase YrpB (nitropropane dioxygenase family)